MANRSRRSKRTKKYSRKKYMPGRAATTRRAATLSRKIDSYLKTLKSGGGRLDAWQDKYPIAGTSPWVPSNNITKYPALANSVFYPPGSRGGKRSKRRTRRRGGGYIIPPSYFGRKPIDMIGPTSSPNPALKAWVPANA